MHHEEIKAAMRMAGVTPAMLAEELDVSQPLVSRVIRNQTTSARVAARIAEVIGIPVNELFPPKPRLERSFARK